MKRIGAWLTAFAAHCRRIWRASDYRCQECGAPPWGACERCYYDEAGQ